MVHLYHVNKTEQHGHLGKVWSKKQAHSQLRLPPCVTHRQAIARERERERDYNALARRHVVSSIHSGKYTMYVPTEATWCKITVVKAQRKAFQYNV